MAKNNFVTQDMGKRLISDVILCTCNEFLKKKGKLFNIAILGTYLEDFNTDRNKNDTIIKTEKGKSLAKVTGPMWPAKRETCLALFTYQGKFTEEIDKEKYLVLQKDTYVVDYGPVHNSKIKNGMFLAIKDDLDNTFILFFKKPINIDELVA